MADKSVSLDPRLSETDYRRLAESIEADWRGRKKARGDLERQWDEIDRQLGMKPEVSHKLLATGRKDRRKAWMPEVELPLQAQTLEMLTADSRRLKFPPSGQWFRARADLSQDYLRRYDGLPSPIGNDVNEAGSSIAQDNADVLAVASVAHWHRQYDFERHVDLIDTEAFKYGFGPARLKRVQLRVLGHEMDADRDAKIPVLVPRSARRVYPDENEYAVLHEGHAIGPNIIQERCQRISDLKIAAEEGGSDIDDEEGGWRMDAIRSLAPRDDDTVDLLELEGDVVLESSEGTSVYRNMIVTAAVGGKKGGSSLELVRVRRGEPFSSYLFFEYHPEDILAPRRASPLVKGMPIARAAAQALNRVIESALLKIQPPIGHGRDAFFGLEGGPNIYPGANWETVEDLKVYSEVGGDPQALFSVYAGLINQYYDVVGVNPPRLGAQTVSHTTAFAKDVELTRGTIRTLDYVSSTLAGPMTRLLRLEYRMGRSLFSDRKPTPIYVDAWDEFVHILRGHLPDIVQFKAIGAGQPLEEANRMAERLRAVQLALQIDAAAVQMGREPQIDHGALIRQVLSQGGWTDVDAFAGGSGAPPGAEQRPQVGGVSQQPGLVTATSPLLEAIG